MDNNPLSPQQRALKEARAKSRAIRTHGMCDCGQPGTRRGAEYVCQRCRTLECMHYRRGDNSLEGQTPRPAWAKYVKIHRIAAAWSMEIV